MGDKNIERILPPIKDFRKDTIGLTYKHWNQLLKGKTIKDFDNVQEILSSNEPLNLFEESLRLIMIDSLKSKEDVLRILLSQDDYKIQRILNCKWFFQNAVTPEFYFKEIFPNVSVVVRNKIINKLSKVLPVGKEAEAFLEFVRVNYRREAAEIFLPKCSEQFLIEYIRKWNPLFQYKNGPSNLLRISKRYPECTITVLTNILNSHNEIANNLVNFNAVLKFLARKFPDLFIPFFQTNHSKLHFLQFNRIDTRRICSKMTDWLTHNSSALVCFHNQSLFKLLDMNNRENFVVAQVLLEKEYNLYGNWLSRTKNIASLLKLLKPEDRHDFIKRTFEKIYSTNYWETPKAWTSDIFEVLPLKVREIYIERFYEYAKERSYSEGSASAFEPETILYLYKFDDSFPKMKTVLSKSSNVERRRHILLQMIWNCKINQESSKIPELTSYVLSRHRNDDPTLITGFLTEINRHFSFTAFSLQNIEEIEEFMTLCALKEGTIDLWTYACVMEICIFYRLENNLDAKVQVKNVVELSFIPRCSFYHLVSDYKVRHSKKLIEMFCDELFLWSKTVPEDKVMRLYRDILGCFSRYKEESKRDKIDLKSNPWFYECFEKVMKKEHGNLAVGDLHHMWEIYNVNVLDVWYRPTVLRYTFKRNPKVILNNLEDVLNDFFTRFNCYFLEVFKFSRKIFSFLNITPKVRDIILKKIKTGETSHRLNAMKMYSYLESSDEFSKTIQEYLPTRGKVDLESDKSFLQIQLFVPRVIRNATPRYKNLQLALKFFTGDFLKNARVSLVACAYSTKVQDVLPVLVDFLENKSEGRVSLQKDFIRLIADFLNPVDGVAFCVDTWNKNKHHSIRQILLQYVFCFFLEEPTQESFAIYKKCLEESDETVLESRSKFYQMPKPFLGEYAACLWNFPQFRNSILSFFSNKMEITHLSDTFSERVISENLFNSKLNVFHFTAHFILSKDKTNLFMDLWEKSLNNIRVISEFLTILMDVSWSYTPSQRIRTFQYILSKWPYSHIEILYQKRLLLKFFVAFALQQNGFITQAKLIWKECNMKSLYPVFGSSLSDFLISVRSNNVSYDLWADILNVDFDDVEFCLILIMVLPEEATNCYNNEVTGLSVQDKNNINEVLSKLSKVEDDVVRICFRDNFLPKV